MSVLVRFWRIVVAILREIGDENAYRRHLAVHHRPHSGAEWRRFFEERMRRKYQQTRCC